MSHLMRVAGVAAVSALLLAACAGTTGDPPKTNSSKPDAAASPSPSQACPGRDAVLAAVRETTEDTAGSDTGEGYDLTRRGVIACEQDYATAEVLYPGSDPTIVVLHLTGGRWRTVVMGTDVCSGEGDDGRKRPRWMVGVPDSVVTAAHCQPDAYRD